MAGHVPSLPELAYVLHSSGSRQGDSELFVLKSECLAHSGSDSVSFSKLLKKSEKIDVSSLVSLSLYICSPSPLSLCLPPLL